ncbi:MAG: PDZ domain-containing protein, partial [Ferrovibrionaceae bacterium]
VVVTEVTDDGPAAQRDVQPGDLILEVGQNEVKTPDDVIGRAKEAQGQKRRSVLVLLQRGADRRYLTIPFKG